MHHVLRSLSVRDVLVADHGPRLLFLAQACTIPPCQSHANGTSRIDYVKIRKLVELHNFEILASDNFNVKFQNFVSARTNAIALLQNVKVDLQSLFAPLKSDANQSTITQATELRRPARACSTPSCDLLFCARIFPL